MKRTHVILIILVLFGGWLAHWPLSPSPDLKMLVVNKTVPDHSFREHRAIFWIAEHRRFTKPGGEFYRLDQDYLGYHPATGNQETLTASDLADLDLLYLADSYGIYNYPEGFELYEAQLPDKLQKIELLYGGLNLEEVKAVEDFSLGENKFIIGEHNIFGYPTYLDPEASLRLQALFAVNYSGWLARYYSDLDQVAFWLKKTYEAIYGQQWELSGPGMIFVHEEVPSLGWRSDLVVITADELSGPWPVINTMPDQLTGRASQNIPYLYWIEVLEVLPNAEVLAYYELPLADGSRAALEKRGLPERFPAMVHYNPTGAARRIYFAGDFADQLPALLTPRLTGSARVQRFISYLPGLPTEYRFYFQWYEPVLTNILHEAAGE
jgi:hypothetical protein